MGPALLGHGNIASDSPRPQGSIYGVWAAKWGGSDSDNDLGSTAVLEGWVLGSTQSHRGESQGLGEPHRRFLGS